ncbi:MAG: DUF1501 domain-containing protein [Planctomycetales bacterium]|nr:DUF1501 domain-containing protein [Planctomycetales bacterium]
MASASDSQFDGSRCGRVSRRSFLADCGMGFTGLALGAMMHDQGLVWAASEPHAVWHPPTGLPHFAPKAKSVIWLFMLGGTSHLESFDHKPMINQFAGKTIDESPLNDAVVNSPFFRKNARDFTGEPRKFMATILPLQTGFKRYGESGIEVSDWWPHVGEHVDNISFIRSMWTTDNDHAAQLQFHTGRHVLDGYFPSIGAWVHYGLGALNENLPQFIALGDPPKDCCGGVASHGGDYLGPAHSAVQLSVDPHRPLAFGSPGSHVYLEEKRAQLDFLQSLNAEAGVAYPDDPEMQARIKSYELAFRMQMAVPEVVKLSDETPSTLATYGFNNEVTRPFAEKCLTARRLVEKGVRFVQIYHDGWDAHSKLKENHTSQCAQVDQPIGALLGDLQQRGLLDETLVVWATEFGRTPGVELRDTGSFVDGRDHHNYGFSVWMAGGGIQGGVTHGATDELGFHAVEDRHYVTDIHATVLRQLGLDPRRLEVPGQKRIEIDYGRPIDAIIA